MFFILSKIFSFVLKPVAWIIISLVLSFFLKSLKWKKFFFIAGIFLLLLFTNRAIFQWSVHSWEPKPISMDKLNGKYDYIILLGGYSNFQTALGKTQFQIGGAGNRLITTLALYKKGFGNKIILTGGSGKLIGDKFSEAVYVAPYLKLLGLGDSLIIEESKSRNTWENALYTKEIIDSITPNASCLLVTSALHMPRSLACFERAGLKTTPYPTDYLSQDSDHFFDKYIEPSSHTLFHWEAVIHEWIGVIAYKLKGYN